jgi:glutaredoxin
VSLFTLFCANALKSAASVEHGCRHLEVASVSKMVRGFLVAAALCLVFAPAAPNPAEAACDKSVVLYNAYWCPFCKKVRALLGSYHIRYQLIEVTAEPGQSMALKRFGDTSVPRTVIGGAVATGYDPERIKQLLCLN